MKSSESVDIDDLLSMGYVEKTNFLKDASIPVEGCKSEADVNEVLMQGRLNFTKYQNSSSLPRFSRCFSEYTKRREVAAGAAKEILRQFGGPTLPPELFGELGMSLEIAAVGMLRPRSFRVMVVGETSNGKSTLLNLLLGLKNTLSSSDNPVLPTGGGRVTNDILEITGGSTWSVEEFKDGAFVPVEGTFDTRSLLRAFLAGRAESSEDTLRRFRILTPDSSLLSKCPGLTLIDAPGLNSATRPSDDSYLQDFAASIDALLVVSTDSFCQATSTFIQQWWSVKDPKCSSALSPITLFIQTKLDTVAPEERGTTRTKMEHSLRALHSQHRKHDMSVRSLELNPRAETIWINRRLRFGNALESLDHQLASALDGDFQIHAQRLRSVLTSIEVALQNAINDAKLTQTQLEQTILRQKKMSDELEPWMQSARSRLEEQHRAFCNGYSQQSSINFLRKTLLGSLSKEEGNEVTLQQTLLKHVSSEYMRVMQKTFEEQLQILNRIWSEIERESLTPPPIYLRSPRKSHILAALVSGSFILLTTQSPTTAAVVAAGVTWGLRWNVNRRITKEATMKKSKTSPVELTSSESTPYSNSPSGPIEPSTPEIESLIISVVSSVPTPLVDDIECQRLVTELGIAVESFREEFAKEVLRLERSRALRKQNEVLALALANFNKSHAGLFQRLQWAEVYQFSNSFNVPGTLLSDPLSPALRGNIVTLLQSGLRHKKIARDHGLHVDESKEEVRLVIEATAKIKALPTEGLKDEVALADQVAKLMCYLHEKSYHLNAAWKQGWFLTAEEDPSSIACSLAQLTPLKMAAAEMHQDVKSYGEWLKRVPNPSLIKLGGNILNGQLATAAQIVNQIKDIRVKEANVNVNILPRRKVRILTLDGGGSRGIIAATILGRLRGSNDGVGLPVHQIFNMIGGTSTGGLQAMMYGVKSMEPENVADFYISLAPKLFGSTVTQTFLKLLQDSPRYNSTVLAEELTKLFKEEMFQRSANPPSPYCFVCAVPSNEPEKLKLVRNYDAQIWSCRDAGLATSAAPTFFGPHVVDGHSYVDGALGANNPSWVAIQEAHSKELDVECLVSIGTGREDNSPSVSTGKPGYFELPTLFSGHREAIRIAMAALTETQRTHQQVKQHCSSAGIPYFRFNPVIPKGLMLMDISDVASLKSLQRITLEYLLKKETTFRDLVSLLRRLPR